MFRQAFYAMAGVFMLGSALYEVATGDVFWAIIGMLWVAFDTWQLVEEGESVHE